MKEKKWQKNDTISIIYLIFMKKIRIKKNFNYK